MKVQSYRRAWKFLIWAILSAALLALMILPLAEMGVPLVDFGGIASAQTGPAAAEFPGGGPACSCFRPAIGTSVVRTSLLANPPVPAIPAVGDDGILVSIPAFEPLGLPPSEVPIVVPDGVIDNPVGVIDFDLISGITNVISSTPPLIGGTEFDVTTPVFQQIDHGTLIVEAEPFTPTVARLEPLQGTAAQAAVESILRPNGISNLPADSNVTRVLHVFNLDLYNAVTGEKISIHDLDLLLTFCLRSEFYPDTPTILRLVDVQNQTYEIVENQQYAFSSRTNATYVAETSPALFALVTIRGTVPQIDPLLLSGRVVEDAPPFCTPNQKVPCQCGTLPLGVADIQSELVSFTRPPKDIVVEIPPAPAGSFNPIRVPGGFINQKVSVVNTDFGTDCEDGSMLVPAPALPDGAIRLRYTERPLDDREKQTLLDELNRPGSIPDLLPSQAISRIISVFDLNLSEAATGTPITDHIPELVLRTCFKAEFGPETPLVLRLDEDSGQYLRPVQEYSHPVRVLVTYPDQTGTTFVVATFGEVTPGSTESISPSSVEEVAAAAEQATSAEPLFASILREYIPSTIIPAGLPGTSASNETGQLIEPASPQQAGQVDGTTVLLWSLVGVVGVGAVAIVLWRRQVKRS